MRATVSLAIAALMTLGGGAALAQVTGDAEAGKRLAELWCSSCHLVSIEQENATTEAPPFAEIARDADDELEWMRAFLMDPHPRMPQLSLSRNEIRNLVAYIASLDPT